MPIWSKRGDRVDHHPGQVPKSVRDAIKGVILNLPDIPAEHHRSLYMSSQVAVSDGCNVYSLASAVQELCISSLQQDRALKIAHEIMEQAKGEYDRVSAAFRNASTTKRGSMMEAQGANGKFIISGNHLTISRKGSGLLTLLNLGLQGDKVIPLHQITAVELRKPGFARGYLRLSLNGRDPVGGVTEAARDENALMLDRRDFAQAEKFKDALLGMIGSKQPMTQTPIVSVADELTKLADLHTKGFLSDKEFASEKAKLLSG